MSKRGRKRSYRSRVKAAYHRAGSPRIPVTLTYLGTGAVVDVFNLAPATRKTLFDGIAGIAKQAGISVAVNGYTIGAVLVALKGLCALSPWLHAKVNGFLAGFYMKI